MIVLAYDKSEVQQTVLILHDDLMMMEATVDHPRRDTHAIIIMELSSTPLNLIHSTI
jgi:hypothetical protein